MTSSDDDVNILTISFCLTCIFILSGSGFSGFTYIEMDRSINRSGAMIAPYTLTTKSVLELFSPVITSDEDISIFRVYYCTYQLTRRPLRHGIICEKTADAPAKHEKLFQNKTQARKALWVTLAL